MYIKTINKMSLVKNIHIKESMYISIPSVEQIPRYIHVYIHIFIYKNILIKYIAKWKIIKSFILFISNCATLQQNIFLFNISSVNKMWQWKHIHNSTCMYTYIYKYVYVYILADVCYSRLQWFCRWKILRWFKNILFSMWRI